MNTWFAGNGRSLHQVGLVRPPRTLPRELGHWLAGFVDGEGCFVIRPAGRGFACSFVVKLRADDSALLVALVEQVGVGRVKPAAARGRNPQSVWLVSDKAGCLFLTEVFDEYPLLSKKRRDYALWREAVIFWASVGGGRTDWAPVADLYERLRTVRVFPTEAAHGSGAGTHYEGSAP